ncbi:MAG: D-alanine--D-alanine ligase [Candidatus Altimarinota bacterium]
MNIAILTGGISTERAVALRSAANMSQWIEKAGHQVQTYDLPEEVDAFLQAYKNYELVIPVFHGRYGEDGIITGMCETLGIKVAGCSSSVHALCIDKFRTNCVVEKIGVKIPKSWIPGLPHPQKLLPSEGDDSLEKALIIKPNQGGSSLATSKARTLEEFHNGINSVNEVIESLTQERILLLGKSTPHFVRQFPSLSDVPMVQECIEGREFTVGAYKDSLGIHILPIIEIITQKGDFFDYEEKYETDGSNEVFSDIEGVLKNALERQSAQIYEFIGCRGIVRMDWRYDGKDIYFLEVNTIPGFSTASLVPKMWKKAGKTESDFMEMLLAF